MTGDAKWMAEECAVQADAAAEAWRTFEHLADHAAKLGLDQLLLSRLALARRRSLDLMDDAVRCGELLKNTFQEGGTRTAGADLVPAVAAGEAVAVTPSELRA